MSIHEAHLLQSQFEPLPSLRRKGLTGMDGFLLSDRECAPLFP